MYSLSSASVILEPLPLTMKGGVPPTDLKARTGLSTPPGRYFWASLKSFSELVKVFMQHSFIRIDRNKTPEAFVFVHLNVYTEFFFDVDFRRRKTTLYTPAMTAPDGIIKLCFASGRSLWRGR